MDCSLITVEQSLQSVTDQGEPVEGSPTFSEVFDEVYPYYMYLGMSYEEFWNEDPYLVRYYREANRVRNEVLNNQYWLQGAYFYEALCRVSPVFNPYAPSGTKAHPYLEEPYDLGLRSEKEIRKEKERKELARQKEVHQRGEMYMLSMMNMINAQFEGGRAE